jgi:acyl-ACP thioesterase
MLLDLTSRKPVRITKDILDRIPHTPGKLKENIALEKIPAMEESNDQASTFKVEYSDLDMNHHVNNINYLKWVLNDFDFEFRRKFRLQSIETNFLGEALYADKLSRETINSQENNQMYITKIINSNSQKLIINSRTKWVSKD